MIRRWSPEEIGPPVGQYSHLARIPAGYDTVHISGQVGTERDGTLAGPDAYRQTRRLLANIETLLATLHATPDSLVKIFTMVAGADHVAGVRQARTEVFERWFPDRDWPAQTLVVVAALAAPEIVVEIEGVAAIAPADPTATP